MGAVWQERSASDSLVESERAFAALLAEQGIREAFLTVMADEAVLFRPRPVNGRQWFADNPAPPGVLSWEPKRIEISAAGDLGYTTGPWRYETDGGGPLFGHYLSVWKRAESEAWRLVLDLGVSHPKPDQTLWDSTVETLNASASESADPGRLRQQLLERDGELGSAVAETGLRRAYESYGAADLILFRNGSLPVSFASAAGDFVGPQAKLARSVPAGGDVSLSADLGYTYGTAEPAGELPGYSYARVWRRDDEGSWRFVVEVLLPG